MVRSAAAPLTPRIAFRRLRYGWYRSLPDRCWCSSIASVTHSPMLSRYQAMLDVYDPIRRENMRRADVPPSERPRVAPDRRVSGLTAVQ